MPEHPPQVAPVEAAHVHALGHEPRGRVPVDDTAARVTTARIEVPVDAG